MLIKLIKLLKYYNKIDKSINQMYKSVSKYGKVVEKLEKEMAILKKNSHPPVFTEKQRNDLDDRLSIVEGFIDNVEKISTEYMKDIAN